MFSNETYVRIANGFMASFFGLAAYVQLNDPDAAVWFTAYLIPAVVCFSEATHPRRWARNKRLFVFIGLVISGPLMAISIWNWFREPLCRGFNPLICEYGREGMGSAIAISWSTFGLLRRSKTVSSRGWLLMAASILPMALWAGLLLGDAVAYFCIPVT